MLKLANGKRLTLLANDPKKNIYIHKVELNGKQIDTNFITYAQLMEGGELRFTLSDKPDKSRGISEEASPYSYTKEKVVSIPYVDRDLNLFMDKVTVALATTTEGAELRYTLDGTEPTEKSLLYDKPFKVDMTTQIKAKGFKEGFRPSRTLSITATKAELKASLPVHPSRNGTSYKYFEGTYQKVADIEKTPLLEVGVLPEPSIKEAKQKDHFGYIFSGLINVPEDGVYIFQTRSDDGSVLYIGNELVVNNDGSHAAIPATGYIALEKGFHPYILYYFEDYEGECRLGTLVLDAVIMMVGGNLLAAQGAALMDGMVQGLLNIVSHWIGPDTAIQMATTYSGTPAGISDGSAAIAIIGGADGPTAIFVTSRYNAQTLWGLAVKIFSNVIVVVLNYVFSKLIIFKKKK